MTTFRPAILAVAATALSLLLTSAQTEAMSYKILYGMQPGVGILVVGGLWMDKSGNLYGTAAQGGSNSCGPVSCGTVFELAADGTASTLYNFAGYPNDGSSPEATLISDKAGNFYGTTYIGGTIGSGTIFKLAPNGTETALYSFTDGADGADPISGLVADSSGNLYGTTSVGISPNTGAVFELSKKGKFRVLETFVTDTGDGDNPEGGLVIDPSGNLYGTTYQGGTNGDGTIYEIAANGTFSVLHSFSGGPDDCNGPEDTLLLDKNGNLYGTTYYGGDGIGCIFEYSSNGTETKLFSFANAKKDGENPVGGLVEDAVGNLYGTTYGGGTKGYGVVFEISPQGKETILHDFGGYPNDGAYPEARLIVGKKGELYGTTSLGGPGCNRGCGTIFEIKE